MKKVYQNIKFLDFDRIAFVVKIRNDFSFTNLNKFDFYYIVRQHGKEIYKGRIKDIAAEPGQTVTSPFLNGIPAVNPSTGDVRIEFYAAIRTPEPFLPAGTVIAREQTYVYTFHKKDAPRQAFATPEDNGRQLTFSGADFTATFDKQSGLLVSYRYKKQEFIHNGQGPRPFFWRAPIDNDYGARLPVRLKAWKEASYQEPKAENFDIVRGKDSTAVKVTYRFPQTDARWDITYKVYSNGVIKVNNHFVAENAQAPMIPRVGLRMQLPARITSLAYYGRGPEENYRDRRTSQFFGEYTSDIKDMYEPYVRPQENNHRTDIYWCTLTSKAKRRPALCSRPHFRDERVQLSVGKSRQRRLHRKTALHAPPRPIIATSPTRKPFPRWISFIDYRMMGIGGDNSWGSFLAHEPYLIHSGKQNSISYGFTIVPFDKKTDFKSLIYQY